jgi:uncharacterized protein (TIGR00369 family)
MSIWLERPTVEELMKRTRNTLAESIGMEYLEVGDDYIKARIPVDERTRQPYGLLHGGASLALAETLGSVGPRFCIDQSKKNSVGLEVNGNHLKAVSDGYVYGTARPIHMGSRTHVWDVRITDDNDRLIHIARVTTAIIDKS